jgi:hypothetical protein
MRGSTRAELQSWKIDIAQNTARIVSSNLRQIGRMDARLDVNALVVWIATMIT